MRMEHCSAAELPMECGVGISARQEAPLMSSTHPCVVGGNELKGLNGNGRNLCRAQPRAAQQCILVNDWAGILRDHIIGLFLLPRLLDGKAYLIFMQQVLP
ncbi:hypothetical protein TNCV_1760221 [Trichonephila clavipes]|nr:hypothetical protein TNCV_1760221 [Trichonephila clavipes]